MLTVIKGEPLKAGPLLWGTVKSGTVIAGFNCRLLSTFVF